MTRSTVWPDSLQSVPTVKYVFGALVAVILLGSIGQWYAIDGLDALTLGIPLWLWIQVPVIAVLLVISWVAVSLWTAANDADRRYGERGDRYGEGDDRYGERGDR